MVVVPSADIGAAAGNPFLRRYQSGRDCDSRYYNKQKYEHSKWHVHRRQAFHFVLRSLQKLEGKRYSASLRQQMVPRYRRASTLGTAPNALDGSFSVIATLTI